MRVLLRARVGCSGGPNIFGYNFGFLYGSDASDRYHLAGSAHYSDVIMGAMASQITILTIVYSTVYSGADQRKHQKLRVTGLCVGNSPVTGEFPAQMASNAENVAIR